MEDAKAWLRVDTDADDALITSLISEVIELAENWLNIAIPEQTIELQASERLSLDLLFRPSITINSVKDLDDVDLDYTYDGFTILLTKVSSVIVNYSAGYENGVPNGLVVGLKELLAYLYENRGDVETIDKVKFIRTNLAAYNKQAW